MVKALFLLMGTLCALSPVAYALHPTAIQRERRLRQEVAQLRAQLQHCQAHAQAAEDNHRQIHMNRNRLYQECVRDQSRLRDILNAHGIDPSRPGNDGDDFPLHNR